MLKKTHSSKKRKKKKKTQSHDLYRQASSGSAALACYMKRHIQGNSQCCIVGNWTCFTFLKTFRLSSKWISDRV